MNRLIDYAQGRLAAINNGTGRYTDDKPMIIAGANYVGFNNLIINQDVSYLAHTEQAWSLLTKNGSVTQIVPTVRVASGGVDATDSFLDGSIETTVRRFLSTFRRPRNRTPSSWCRLTRPGSARRRCTCRWCAGRPGRR